MRINPSSRFMPSKSSMQHGDKTDGKQLAHDREAHDQKFRIHVANLRNADAIFQDLISSCP